MNKSVQDAHQCVLVITKHLHGKLASDAEHAFNAGDSETVDNVLRQAEWHTFRYA